MVSEARGELQFLTTIAEPLSEKAYELCRHVTQKFEVGKSSLSTSP
jgi:hypothetical protein